MTIERHKGYKTIKLLIEGGQIKTFKEIFEHIPKTTVFKDLGTNYYRSGKIMKSVQEMKLAELYTLAHFIGVDEKILLDLAHAQYVAGKKKK